MNFRSWLLLCGRRKKWALLQN